MSEIDLDQLVKILNLTTSDNDNEALSAIRKANSMIKNANIEWSKVIQKPKENRPYRWKQAPEYFNSAFFKSMVECEDFTNILTSDQRESINGLIRYYNRHKSIPQKYWTDLHDLWNNFREVSR